MESVTNFAESFGEMKMLLLISLVLASAAAVPRTPDASAPNVIDNLIPVGGNGLLQSARIVGGSAAEQNEWPWQVSLQLYRGAWYHFCGGSLIADQWVITAAHCLDGMEGETLRVALGEHVLDLDESTEQHRDVASYYIHEQYSANSRGIPNDIGLIRLQEPADLNEYVQTVPYAAADDTFSSSDVCFISGWGLTSATGSASNILKKSDMTVIPENTCSRSWRRMIFDFHICINDADYDSSACMGDSGGPLVCEVTSGYVLAGLTSWGSSECHLHLPNVYTRISSFRGWIDGKMQAK